MSSPLSYSAGPTAFDDWLTSTAKYYMDEGMANDNIYNYMALPWHLKSKSKMKVVDSGVDVTHQIRYAKMGGGKWYYGAELLSTQGTQTLTNARYLWKNVAVPIVIDGNEKRGNRDTSAILNLLSERTDNASEALRDLLATALVATSQDSAQPESLETLIGTTSSTGGISGTTYSWWQATITSLTSASFAARGLSDLMTNWMTVEQGPNRVDLIYSAKDVYRFYWQQLQPAQRFESRAAADAGFDNLTFMGATWMYDDYVGAGRVYGINSKQGLRFTAMKGANVEVNSEVRPANQDAWVRQVILQCASSTPNRRRNFKISGTPAYVA